MFIIRTLTHCAILNLLAIGLTELDIRYQENYFWIADMLALLPIGIFILKASKIRFYGIQEAHPIRDLRFKSTSKILFLLSFLVCVPYYWFRDSDEAYMIWSLNWGFYIDLGVYQGLLSLYVFVQTVLILRENGWLPLFKRKKANRSNYIE